MSKFYIESKKDEKFFCEQCGKESGFYHICRKKMPVIKGINYDKFAIICGSDECLNKINNL